jgi:hypothetical protein
MYVSHRQVVTLVREIRDLYARTCGLATRYNQAIENETNSLRQACKARPQKLIPELEYFENVFDRQEALRKALATPALRGRSQAFGAVTWFGIFLVAWYALPVGGSMLAGFLIPAVLGCAAIVAHQRVVVCSRPVRRSLREQLVARGVPLCLDCGYDLRGHATQTTMRCPECGHGATPPLAPFRDFASMGEG